MSVHAPTSSQAKLDNLERLKKRNRERLAQVMRTFDEKSEVTTMTVAASTFSNSSDRKESIRTISTTENTEFDENDDNVSHSSSSTCSPSLMNPYSESTISAVPAWFSDYIRQQESRQQQLLEKLNNQMEEIDRLRNQSGTKNTITAPGQRKSIPLNLQPVLTSSTSPTSELTPSLTGEEKKESEWTDETSVTQVPLNGVVLLNVQPLAIAEQDANCRQNYLSEGPASVPPIATVSTLSSDIRRDEHDQGKKERKHNAREVFRDATKKAKTGEYPQNTLSHNAEDPVRNADKINIATKLEDATHFFQQLGEASKGAIEKNERCDQDEQDVTTETQQQPQDRLNEVQRDIERAGTYVHTPEELEFGCQLAWQNDPRLNALEQVSELVVRDSRYVSSAKDCFDDLIRHLKLAFNDGTILPVITVYRAKQDSRSAPVRIWNRQILGYAAYELADGNIMGDPINLPFTALCQKFGWSPPKVKTDFDVLPLLISDASTGHTKPQVFEIPSEEVPEIRITHPEFKLFEMLNLRCISMSCISNMGIEIGGVHYQTTCFSQRCHVAEIGRRFLDSDRYNLAESVAVACDIRRRPEVGLWKDAARMELHKACLYSFEDQCIPYVDQCKTGQNVNHVEKPRFRSQLNIWEDLQIEPSEPVVAESTRGISRSYSLQREESIIYSKVLIYHASEFGKALRMATILSCEFGNNATGPMALDELPDLLHRRPQDDENTKQKERGKTLVIVVASTRGTGEAPESAKTFVEQMKMVPDNSVCDVEFSILALGNAAYRQSFAAFGHRVFTLLEKVGCIPALDMQIADELQNPGSALNAFTKLLRWVYTGQEQDVSTLGDISVRPPAYAIVSLEGRTKLLEMSSTKEKDHYDPGLLHHSSSWASRAHRLRPSMDMFTFKVHAGYESLLDEVIPGDLVALYPSNMFDVVELVSRNADSSRRIVAREYLQSNIDLSRPMKPWDIEELGRTLQSEEARKVVDIMIASHSSQENYPSIEQLIQMLPPGSIPMEWIVRYGPPIDPRFFCIADVNLLENTVSFSQSVYLFESNKKAGLASRWLRSLGSGQKTNALFVTTSKFHAPSNRDGPLLLFAADSGISSFHSMWQSHCRNPMYLFYECKDPSEIAYRSKISELKVQGRLQPYIAYRHVKRGRFEMGDLILRAKDVLLKCLHNSKGIIYLSGPPKFERTVRSGLVTVLAEGNEFHPGMGTIRALEFLAILSQTDRFFFQVHGPPSLTEDHTLVLWQEAVAKVVRTITDLEQVGLPRGRTDDTFAFDSDLMPSSRIRSGKRYNPKIVFSGN